MGLTYAYLGMHGTEELADYKARHDIQTEEILTVYDDDTADLVANYLAPRIQDKAVIEIGGGNGALARHMAAYARKVICIDANPVWAMEMCRSAWNKPRNLSFMLGDARQLIGQLRANVALFCSRSGVPQLTQIAAGFAPVVIDVLADAMAAHGRAINEQRVPHPAFERLADIHGLSKLVFPRGPLPQLRIVDGEATRH